MDLLIEAVWPSGPPATARNQIAICVAGLRKVFNEKTDGVELITTSRPGYVLNSLEHHIDSIEFERRISEARQAARSGQTAAASALITQALALWRGPALDGLSGGRIEAEAAHLESVRLNLSEEYAELQLKLGRHRTLIPELTTLVREHPLREQARAHLILAHYRAGRRADALAVFREGRDLMAEELGIEPGPALQALHNLVLKDSPTLVLPANNPTPAPHTRAPAQLPVQSASFTGRLQALSDLDGMLDERLGQSPLMVAAISGVSGVGKTALAVHWANQVAARFPDGQLFTDLRGYHEKEPVTANAVLDQFLRALGVPATQIPAELDERAALYRSTLGGKRVLVVLDNVRDVEQIRPLFPGNGRCCVVITSRDPMVELLGDYALLQVPLHVMSPDEARNLLAEIAGSSRIESSPDATADLTTLCDRLPLALRIAGARLAAKPYWTVRDLALRLRDQRRRLDELSLGDVGVRAGFRLSYRDLSESARRLYRRIGLLTVPDFAAWAAATLIGTGIAEAESLLEELLDAQLLAVSSTHCGPVVRYRCQDLLRVFAWECAQTEEDEAERGAALEQLYASYLQIADAARQRRYGGSHLQGYGAPLATPQPADLIDLLVEDPMAWFESERTSITDVIAQAAAADHSSYAWGLTVNTTMLFEAKNYLEDWHSSATVSLTAAQRTGDRRGEATMLRSLGTRAIYQRRYEDAEAWLQPALELFEKDDDPHGLAVVQRNLALCRRFVGDLTQAQDLTQRSLDAFRLAGDLAGESHALGLLGQIELENGRIDSGIALSTQAITKSRQAGSRRGEAQNTYRLAEAMLRQGDHVGAEHACFAVLELLDREGDRLGEGHALRGIGEARWRRGDAAEAVTVLHKAMSAAKDVNDRYLHARVLTDLGCAELLLGLPESLERLAEAQSAFLELGASTWVVRSSHLAAAAQHAFESVPPTPPSPAVLVSLTDS